MSAPEIERADDAAGARSGLHPSDSVLERFERLHRQTMEDVVMQSELPPSGIDGGKMQGHAAGEPLRELALGALRGAFLSDARASDSESHVRVLLRQACEVARARGLHVEQMLILLKELWQELPHARHVSHDDAQATLTRVVSLCIEEYYEPWRSA